MKLHHYKTNMEWTGNKGSGTLTYDSYERSHVLRIANKPDVYCSSDTPFRGDATKHNPEDMLLASLSSCHMLWYLHLCADAGIIVTNYEDNAIGTMQEIPGSGGRFVEVVLHPQVSITDASKIELAIALHQKAHACCFIANSVNFPVRHLPICKSI
jgi:organic hydroperoxide reductase OsmC/OhrA